jgi:hypothetical protein
VTSNIPLLLPLKPSEAASLAEIVFQHLDGRALNDEQRNRLASRAAAMGLTSIRPHWGSLQADPVHSLTYYLAIDALPSDPTQPPVQPMLLRMALSSAPASGLFPKAMLIGRMRPGGGREVVVNAVSFGPGDVASTRTFAQELDRAVLPRPAGAVPALCVAPANPEQTMPAVFEAFRRAHRATGLNYAAAQVAPEQLTTVIWAAIRSGWREGYTVGGPAIVVDPGSLDGAEEAIHSAAEYSKYTLDLSKFEGVQAATEACLELYDFIRREKAINKTGRAFDFEVVPGELPVEPLLHGLRSEGRAAHLVAVSAAEATGALATSVRQYGALLSAPFPGRWHWRYSGDPTTDQAAAMCEQLRT